MSPRTLLRLYPRTWRERYGDEFIDACGAGPLSFQQVIDIVGGAIDARFAPQVHLAAASQTSQPAHTSQGAHMPAVLKSICAHRGANYNATDGLKSAAFMIGSSLVLVAASIICRENDWTDAARFFRSVAFPVSMLLSSLFTFLKGQSAVTKWLVVGGPMFVIIALSVATAIR